MSIAFRRLAVIDCQVKRIPPIDANGKREWAGIHLTGLKCTPLDPITEEIRMEVELSKPYQALQTFLAGEIDIREKDILTVDNVDYVVRACGKWRWSASDDTLRLIIEDASVA
jgi:hypothetical protein